MKAAILCNGINWTIHKKNYLQHVENQKSMWREGNGVNLRFDSLYDKNSVPPLAPVA